MQAATEGGAFRVPLAIRIFLLFVLLIGMVVGAAAWVAQRQSARIADAAVQRALATSAEVQDELTARRLEEVELKAQLIGNDPATPRYVSAATGGGLGLGNDELADSGSIGDLLAERQSQYGFDLGIVLDAQAQVLARSDRAEALEESFAGDPFIEQVLSELTPVSGFWRHGGKLYQAALMPLDQDQDLVGFLLVALEVDDELAARVGRASGADQAFLLPTADQVAVIGSSLAPDDARSLAAAIRAGAGDISTAVFEGRALDRVAFEFLGRAWVGRLNPVDADGGGRLGATLALSSTDQATAGYREILKAVGLAGLAALLAALPLSFLLAKATLRPLKAMASAARDAAGGNYQARLGLRGSDELATLSQAFDRLLSDLREKNDMAGYVSNLSRFLPDPGQEPLVPSFVTRPEAESVATAAAQRERLVLVGLDLRQYARPLADGAAEPVLAAIAARTAAVVATATRYGGQLLRHSGSQLTVGVGGADRLLAALHIARELLAADAAAAAALMEGEVAWGGVPAGRDAVHVAIGPACFAVDRLLVEAGTGALLLPRPLGDAIKALVGEDVVAVVKGANSGKPYYALGAHAFALLPPAPTKAIASAPEAAQATVARPLVAAAPAAPRGDGELAPGVRFGGRYEILAVLGEGGMGVVYKARDIELDDVVALKMLKASALLDREQLERLKSEIKLARKITHPNVLRTFDFGESEGRPYISMEFVRGMTLRYLLRQAGRIPYSAGLRIARQLAAGLGAAHAVGVLHRDIKPENLILEASGNAKLMDFGIARPLQRSEPGQTQPGMYVGTPHYSAPEQLAGEEVDQRADIYASGVLLCEMFCGKLPFSGQNTMEIYLAQMQSQPVRPSEYWPDIPAPLEAAILRCIERDPARRFQDAEALAQALAELRA
jgi:serine/threonine-protein kinase